MQVTVLPLAVATSFRTHDRFI